MGQNDPRHSEYSYAIQNGKSVIVGRGRKQRFCIGVKREDTKNGGLFGFSRTEIDVIRGTRKYRRDHNTKETTEILQSARLHTLDDLQNV